MSNCNPDFRPLPNPNFNLTSLHDSCLPLLIGAKDGAPAVGVGDKRGGFLDGLDVVTPR